MAEIVQDEQGIAYQNNIIDATQIREYMRFELKPGNQQLTNRESSEPISGPNNLIVAYKNDGFGYESDSFGVERQGPGFVEGSTVTWIRECLRILQQAVPGD